MGRAVVIGAGIGGLTAGLALAAEGWQVEVVERAPALRPVGIALLIAPNAQNALATLPGGIVDELHALSCIRGDGGLRDAHGRWLSRDDAAVAQQRYGHPMVLVRRSALVEMLASRLPSGALRLGATASAVDAEAGAVTLASGEVLAGDVVVAADGIHSVTRSSLWPAHPGPVYSGFTGWQTLVSGAGLTLQPGMIWAGGELGTLALTDSELYVFANAAVPARPPRSGVAELGELIARFGRLPAPVPEVLARIDPDRLLRTDIHTLAEPLPAYHRGRVAVLGDAAHAMTPNLGQGACQAIEDAVTLARKVGAVGVAAGLPAYTAARLPRTVEIANRSALIAKLATLRNPALQALRNAALRAAGRLGPSVVQRQADFVMRWQPSTAQGSG